MHTFVSPLAVNRMIRRKNRENTNLVIIEYPASGVRVVFLESTVYGQTRRCCSVVSTLTGDDRPCWENESGQVLLT